MATAGLATLVLLAGLMGCTGASPSNNTSNSQSSVAPVSRPPNVVFLLADDLGWGELGSYGQEKIRTPSLDQLAAEGMRFTQSYSGAPVCAPSRNVLLTGRHLGHVTIRGNKPAEDEEGHQVEGQWPIPAETFTMAEAFKDAGYVTGAFGKWGLGPAGSSGDPNDQGFDRFYGYICQRVAHSYFPPHLWSDGEQVAINREPIPGHRRQPDGEVTLGQWQAESYAPDAMLEQALDFVRQNKEQPFFLFLPFVEPHLAMHPPETLVESYPEAWDPKPYRGQCGYLPHPRPRAGYAAMITDLDEHVGAILELLRELDLEDDTLVVFSSDNGTTHRCRNDDDFGVGGVDADFFDSTRDLRGFKGSVYEGGIRVPMIVRWPGKVAAGSVTDQPTYFADQLPTLAEAVGLEVPEDLDGISILPTLTGQEGQAERNPMVWAFPEYGGQLAVRFGDWKLVRQGLFKEAQNVWELYDMAKDRGETNDRAATHPELVAQGIEILRAEVEDNPLFPVPVPSHPPARGSRAQH